MKKKVLYLILVVVAVFLLYRIYNLVKNKYFMSAGKNRKNSSVAVYADKIAVGDISDIVVLRGDIKALYSYDLRSEVSGTLEKITCNIGQEVKENKTVAFIADREYSLKRMEAEAKLKSAIAELDLQKSKKNKAEADFQRAKTLHSQDFISDSEFEQSQNDYQSFLADYQTAEAGAASAEAQFGLSEIDLQKTRLKASKSGIIADKFFDIGNYISVGNSVFSVVNIDTVIVKTSVSELDYVKVNKGQTVEIKVDSMPEREFTGAISSVAPVLNTDTRMADIEISIVNKDKALRPGMYCSARIYVEQKSGVPLIPNNVFVKKNGVTGVYSVNEEEMKAKFIPVKLGIVSDKFSELVSPDIEGRIVTFGHFQIKDGSSIKITKKTSRD